MEIADGRTDLADYLHRLMGYVATGTTREHKLFILHGEGSNGKSLFCETVGRVLADYTITVASDALMSGERATSADAPTPTLAALAGRRLVIASESREGSRFNSAVVKRLTGDARIRARNNYADPIEFDVSHKVLLLTNHRPALDGLDEATRGRLHLVPFDRIWNRPGHASPDPSRPNGDPQLEAKLMAEAEGILAWLVRGALRYQREGLAPPATVLAQTKAYLDSQDPTSEWFRRWELCDIEGADITSASALREDINQWRSQRGLEEISGKRLNSLLSVRGVPKKDRAAGAFYALRRAQPPGGGDDFFG